MKTSAVGILRRAILVGLVLLVLFGSTATAMSDDAFEGCNGKPYVVKIHADWCGICKALKSVWQRIETDLGDQAIIVTLDVSDRVAYMKSHATAERLGIGEFFQEYRGRTGTIAILDCKTHEPAVIMSAERDFEKYREAVARAVSPS